MDCHTVERHDIYKCFQRNAKALYKSVLTAEDKWQQLMVDKLRLLAEFTVQHWEEDKAHLI